MVTVASAGVLAAEGWASPGGIASFGLFLVGAGSLVWSILQSTRGTSKRQVDVETVAELLTAVEEQRHGHRVGGDDEAR